MDLNLRLHRDLWLLGDPTLQLFGDLTLWIHRDLRLLGDLSDCFGDLTLRLLWGPNLAAALGTKPCGCFGDQTLRLLWGPNLAAALGT